MQNNTSAPKPVRRLLVAAGAATLLTIGGTASAYALTPELGAHVGRFFECFGLMIVDPSTHNVECLPSRHTPGLSSLSDGAPAPEVLTTTTITETETETTTTITTTITEDESLG